MKLLIISLFEVIRIPESGKIIAGGVLESVTQLKESLKEGVLPLNLGIQNPRSTDKESGILYMEFAIERRSVTSRYHGSTVSG